MGDRVAVMDRGVLQQIGTPRTLYHEPANLFVAGFIGSPAMNFVERPARGRQGAARSWSSAAAASLSPASFVASQAGPRTLSSAETSWRASGWRR